MSTVLRASLILCLTLALAACGKSSDSSKTEPGDVAAGARARDRGPAAAGAEGASRVERERPALPAGAGDDNAGDDGAGDDGVGDDGVGDDGEQRVGPGPAMARFDRDGDGKLDEVEKRAMRTSRLNDLMTSVDADGDGKLSRNEMLAGDDLRARRMSRQFDRLDTDGDGALSPDELEAMLDGRGRRGWPGKRSDRPSPTNRPKR